MWAVSVGLVTKVHKHEHIQVMFDKWFIQNDFEEECLSDMN